MDNPTFERTPLVIAAEINMITCQTRKILLISAIEIGRRLQEAKVMLKHGEWIEWIEESVDYTRRTASRLMKIYKEYGPDFPEGSDRSNGTPVSHLTYTQVLLLLGLPKRSDRNSSRRYLWCGKLVVGMNSLYSIHILLAIISFDKPVEQYVLNISSFVNHCQYPNFIIFNLIDQPPRRHD